MVLSSENIVACEDGCFGGMVPMMPIGGRALMLILVLRYIRIHLHQAMKRSGR